MPLFKCTFFYGFQAQGASFSLYKMADDYRTAGADAEHVAVDGFAPLLAQGCVLPSIRVSDDAVEKDSLIVEANIGVGDPDNPLFRGARMVRPASNTPPNDYTSALQVNLINSPQKKGRLFIRFYPDNVAQSVKYVPTQAYNLAMTTFGQVIRNFNFGFKGVASGKGAKITDVQTNGTPPNTLKITAPGHGLAIGNQARISKATGAPGTINGVWEVTGVSGDVVTMGASESVAGFVWTGKGFLKNLTKGFLTIGSISVNQRIAARKSGRPFDTHPGRRSVVRQ